MNTGFFIATTTRAHALGAAARAGFLKRQGGFSPCGLGGMNQCNPKSYLQLDPRENTILPGEGHT